MSKSREQINRFLSQIDITGKRVLDVGAGPKDKHVINFVKGKPKKFVPMDYINHDGSIDYIFNLNCDDPFMIFPFRNFMSEAEVKRKFPFDIVFCLETLEHVWKPIQAVKNLSEWTKEVCYISVPFINPLHDKWDYLRFTPEWFEKVLPMVGFKKVVVKRRYATFGLFDLMKFYREEGLRMSKIRLKAGQSKDQALIGLFVEAYK